MSLRSHEPNLVLLGSPIGEAGFCTQHVDRLRESNGKLLSRLCELNDTQVALHLLRTCLSFCKYVYIARTTPPALVRDALKRCDDDIIQCFSRFAALQLSPAVIAQARLSLSMGGIGLRASHQHCAAAFSW